MNVRPGYKLTEVGEIPEEWKVVPLGQLVATVDYGTSAKSRPRGNVPVLRMGNLQGGRIDWSDLVYTSDTDEIRRYTLRTGDILFNRTNTIDLVGKTSIYLGEQPAVFAGYLIRVAVMPNVVAHFINYFLNAEFARNHSKSVASIAVGQANINGQKLKAYPIPLPPPAEQQAIAGALGDVDALIASLDRLVAKKRDVRQAAMQELLTGRTRLPGFSGGWEVKRLGELASSSKVVVNPALHPGTRFTHFSLPAYDAGAVPILEEAELIESIKLVVPATSVLVSKLNPRIPRIWAPSEIPVNSICSTEFLVFVPLENTSRAFLAAVCRSQRVCSRMELLAVGTTGSHQRITAHNVMAIQVDVPLDPAEQAAIAEVLTDMDAEIAALENRREKTRLLKQGMMRELLTGRTRLT